MRLLAEVQRREAENTIDSISKRLRLGKYQDPKYKCTIGLNNLVEDYRRLAMSFEIIGDIESSENAWKTVLRLINQRKGELQEYQEAEYTNYLSFINRAMTDAYSALGRSYFEYFLIALEIDLPEEQRIYCGRRNIIASDVAEMQKLEEHKYKLLGLSAPPRTGKTLLGTRFLAWVMARHRSESSFFASHSAKMCRKVYDDLMNIFALPGFKRVFPGVTANGNKEDMWIDLEPRISNGYHTLHLAGIDSQMAGVIDCSCLLYCDDLISGIEEAMKPERMENALTKYITDIRQRFSKGSAIALISATRWGTKDPLTYEEELSGDDPRCKFIKRPALNENGESNYMFTKDPMTTEFFLDMKARFDPVSFECIYQQHPIDREGLIFTNLKRYKELPKGSPDIIYMANDVAFSGADNYSGPIAYQYGDDVYIEDVVFSPEGYTTTEPLVIAALKKHCPHFAKFESNNGGDFYAKDIKNAVAGALNTRIYSERTIKNKMYRISQFEPVIQTFYFKDSSLYPPGSMYDRFVRELERFNINGHNKHDDAADSLAMLAEMKRKAKSGSIGVIRRQGKNAYKRRMGA